MLLFRAEIWSSELQAIASTLDQTAFSSFRPVRSGRLQVSFGTCPLSHVAEGSRSIQSLCIWNVDVDSEEGFHKLSNVTGSSVGFRLIYYTHATNAWVKRLYGEESHGDVLTVTKYETSLDVDESWRAQTKTNRRHTEETLQTREHSPELNNTLKLNPNTKSIECS